MRPSRLAAAAVLAAALAGCSGGSPAEPAGTTTEPESGLVTRVVEDARSVADDANRRTADLESMIP